MAVQFFDLKKQLSSIRPSIEKEISEVLDSCAFILGPKVAELEKYSANYLGVKHAIGVASGTDALLLSLKALGIGPGDEVITTPFTFVATLETIAYCGAIPVFVDIDPDTFNIDTAKIKAKITSRTKVILPVHLYGQPSNMDEIMALAKQHNLKVIEDCAQAISAKYDDKFVGSIGDFGCFSFFPTKNLGCYGDGGLVTTNSDDFADTVKVLRGHGSKTTYHYDYIGYNSRLDSMQAAILLARFKHLDAWTAKRRKNAALYRNILSKTPGIILPKEVNKGFHVYNQFTIKSDNRDELQAFLKTKQIGSMIYYPLSLHLQKAFEYLGHKPGDFPISENIQGSVLSLPIYPELNEQEITEVANAIKEFYGQS